MRRPRSSAPTAPSWRARPTGRRPRSRQAINEEALPTLADIVLGRSPGRRGDRDITLFLNYTGLGYQFAATGALIYRRALERGAGRRLDTDWFTSAVPS